jgi:hypothetical protein
MEFVKRDADGNWKVSVIVINGFYMRRRALWYTNPNQTFYNAYFPGSYDTAFNDIKMLF